MTDHAEGRLQSEELSHAVYGSMCMRFNTKVRLLILLEAIKVILFIIDDAHEYIAVAVVRQQSDVHVYVTMANIHSMTWSLDDSSLRWCY